MSTFNKKTSKTNKVLNHETRTTNHEGAIAFTQSPKMELYTRVASCLYGQDKFYVTGKRADTDLQNVLSVVIKEDPEFVLKLAKYTRNQLFLRAVPQVLLSEVFNQAPGTIEGGYKYVPDIVRRADEITEVLAYQLSRNAATKTRGQGQKKIPKSLQKGLRIAMQNFNEYQYAKYDKDGDVTFKDALSLVRPRPKNEGQAKIFETLIAGNKLPIPETWEMNTTINGSTKETWEKNVEVMPIMAMLRNMRNLLQHDVGNLDVAITKLENPEIIAKSKQLPFRFYSAMKEVSKIQSPKTGKVMAAIETAMEHSCSNVPHLDGTTVVMVDLSGSMSSPVSANSNVTMREIASVFGGIATKATDDGMFAGYGSNHKWIPLSAKSSILDSVQKINKTDVGHSTNAHLPIFDLTQKNMKVDRFINFSDMQCYNSHPYYSPQRYGGVASDLTTAFLDYRNKVNPNATMYSIDLNGYGTVKWPENTKGIYTIAGWSNSIFNFIDAMEKGDSVIDLINAC